MESGFTEAETMACCRLIELALNEDLGTGSKCLDITSFAVVPQSLAGQATFVARSCGVTAGLPAAQMVIAALDQRLGLPPLVFEPLVQDGAPLVAGVGLAHLRGPMWSILAAERTSLNFLQRLSGVATLTRSFVDAVRGLTVQILDTRKTTPGWRLLEKYAVRCGGGKNHRMGLYDGILIKDNHLHALHGDVEQAVGNARAATAGNIPIEIEVESLEQLKRVLTCRPEIILLDNMSLAQLRESVHMRNAIAPAVSLEASGGVTLATVRGIAETGVDRISVGALTHSAPALDIALDYAK